MAKAMSLSTPVRIHRAGERTRQSRNLRGLLNYVDSQKTNVTYVECDDDPHEGGVFRYVTHFKNGAVAIVRFHSWRVAADWTRSRIKHHPRWQEAQVYGHVGFVQRVTKYTGSGFTHENDNSHELRA